MNFLKHFASLLMMNPCHCHLIFLSLVRHYYHRYHFYYASLHLFSTKDTKVIFSINRSHHPSPFRTDLTDFYDHFRT